MKSSTPDSWPGTLLKTRWDAGRYLDRFLPREIAEAAQNAIRIHDVEWFSKQCRQLRTFVMRSAPQESAVARLYGRVDEVRRVARRILRPTGLVVGVLGADGSGKTTVVEHLLRELAPAFRRVRRFHFRPRFGTPGGAVVSDPHGRPPRGWIASLAKMMLYVVDYWVGWGCLVIPAKVRSTLVVFDRYFHDMLVDPKRYRLPLQFAPTRWLACLAPTPDIWLVLHASAETSIARKAELDYRTANALGDAYRELAARVPQARLIDTDRELDRTLGDAVKAVRLVLEQRVLASGAGER